ncbi:MAG: hypothetical protein JW704_13075 [Anaerolineaceae bacterium]|nr:hypothetical protein [Anaerolineaceae bacterium]
MSIFNRLDPVLALLCLVLVACSLPFFGSAPVMETAYTTSTEPVMTDITTQQISQLPTREVVLSTPIASLAQAVTLTSLKMFDANNGWAAAIGEFDQVPHLLRTGDSGISWQEMTPAGMATEAGFAESTIIFTAMDLDTIWTTLTNRSPAPQADSLFTWQSIDGGATWSRSDPLPVTDLAMELFMPDNIGFSDRNNGWLLVHNGAGMNHDYVSIFTTANGGASWTRVVDPFKDNLMMSCSKTGLVFLDALNGWVTIDCHGVKAGIDFYSTADGGHTWQAVVLPSPGVEPNYFDNFDNACGLDGILYSRANTLIVSLTCMHYGVSNPQRWLYTTQNDGFSWSWQSLPGGYGEIFLLSPTQAWFLGHINQQDDDASTLYSSMDGGMNWGQVKNVNWAGTPQFVDPKNGWVLARAGLESAFVHTTDGGRTCAEINASIQP